MSSLEDTSLNNNREKVREKKTTKKQTNTNKTNKQQQFFRHSRAAISVFIGLIWPKFEVIQPLMHVPIS